MNSFIGKIKEKIANSLIFLRNLELKNEIFVIIIIFLVGLSSFGLGRLSALTERKIPVTIQNGIPFGTTTGAVTKSQPVNSNSQPSNQLTNQLGLVVASKNGTKYHYPWCSGAKTISDANKIWFATEDEAKKAGYTPAANCKGLK